MKTEKIKVSGMSAGQGEQTVENAVAAINGVESVSANAEKDVVCVTFDPTITDAVRIGNTIERIGVNVVE